MVEVFDIGEAPRQDRGWWQLTPEEQGVRMKVTLIIPGYEYKSYS